MSTEHILSQAHQTTARAFEWHRLTAGLSVEDAWHIAAYEAAHGTPAAQRIARLIATTGRSFTDVCAAIERIDRYLVKEGIDQEAAWEGCSRAAAGIEEAAHTFGA